MKKLTKKIFALALAMGLCFSLCSCDLGRTKDTAYYMDETKNVIVFDNHNYKLLDVPLDGSVIVNAYNPLKVIKKDTPDILAAFLGDDMLYNDQKTIIEYIDSAAESVCYCREDMYAEITQLVNDLNLDYLCYTTANEQSEFEDHMLDDKIAEAVKEIMSSQKPKKEKIISEKFVGLYKCDRNMIFLEEYVDIDMIDDGRCVITSWDEDYNTLVYKIPEEKLKMFEKFVEENYTEFSLF